MKEDKGLDNTGNRKLSLGEIQQRELEMLKEFDRVARKYKLRYTMCAGTLLGAVRHRGFIPWDDDIDVSMPRPDYEKLVRLNRKRNLWSKGLKLASFEDGTMDTPFMKLFCDDVVIKEKNYSEKYVQNLWIDIFPVDGLPYNEEDMKLHYQLALNLCKLSTSSVVRNGYGTTKAKIVLKTLLFKPAANMVGRKRIAALQRKLALKYSYSHAKKVGMVTWAYDGPGQALRKAEYEDLIEMDFEGCTFYGIKAWDKYLSGVFGNYMQLPPEEDRLTHDFEAYYVESEEKKLKQEEES